MSINMVVVQKRITNLRTICLDPINLNKAIMQSHYPFLMIEQVVNHMLEQSQNVYTVINAKTGFWQVELDQKSSYVYTS